MLTEVEKCHSVSEAAHPTQPPAPQSEPRPLAVAAGPATSGCHSRTPDLNADLQTQNTENNQPSVIISKEEPQEGEVLPSPVSILKSKCLEGDVLSPQQPRPILKTLPQSFPQLPRDILQTQSRPIEKANPQSSQQSILKPRRAILVLPRSQCSETVTGVTIQPENLEVAPRGRSPRARVRADPVSPRSIAQDGSDGSPRGRPRAENLNNLMARGATSPSSLKCPYCHRIFPRVKSLQVHLRTHTGTYFTQSHFIMHNL